MNSLRSYRTLKFILLVSYILLFGAFQAYAVLPGEQLWVRRYRGTQNATVEIFNALSIDSNDNVYVSGFKNGCVIIKYDKIGNRKWLRKVSGAGFEPRTPKGMAIDSNDNIYVIGDNDNAGTRDDFAIVKYDKDGNPIRIIRYNSPGNGNDQANAIAIDSNDNVYVSGKSNGSGTGYDYLTVKYDKDGIYQWASRYNGPGNGNDQATVIAIDSNDDVYVSGKSNGSGTGNDYATVKYNKGDGSVVWKKRYNGPGDKRDQPNAIVVDSNKSVYVSGVSFGSGTRDDYATVKYDKNGIRKWVRRYNGSANSWDVANANTVDSNDNIYVSGYSSGSGTNEDYLTIKYDKFGNRKWARRYNDLENGSDVAKTITVDSNDNVFVSGLSFGLGFDIFGIRCDDYLTIKYDKYGARKWIRRYDGGANDVAIDIAVDSSDNVCVGGISNSSGDEPDFAIVKFAP